MIKFYYHDAPNPRKVALMLEEAGLAYEIQPVDIFKGDQHANWYRAINPNGKTPTIEVDGKRVFDSNAILLYLADKYGQFAGMAVDRSELLSWLMFIATGLGPYSGQWIHFQSAGATEGGDYAKRRYKFEARRHYEVMDKHLEGKEFFVSEEFTIVDMAAWGWVGSHARVLGEGGIETFPNVNAWFDRINARPAAERARNIGKDLASKPVFDEESNRAMFPSNYSSL